MVAPAGTTPLPDWELPKITQVYGTSIVLVFIILQLRFAEGVSEHIEVSFKAAIALG